MARKKVICMSLCTVFIFLLLTGCNSGKQGGEITVTDMLDREITLPAEINKVVALSAADCEIIYELGQEDKLIGRGEYCDWPEDILSVESVQTGEETNIEQLIAMKPDLVLMNAMAQTTEQVQQLENANIPVVLSYADNIEEVYVAIQLIGDCLGAADNATALIAEMKQGFEEVQKDLPQSGGTVYFEVSPLEYGLWSAGANTFMDEIASMLNLENAFADLEGWGEISQEQVIDRSPDYIVTVTMFSGEGEAPENEIMARTGWESITAIQNKNVFLMNSDVISRPGPRLVQAASELRRLVYGS